MSFPVSDIAVFDNFILIYRVCQMKLGEMKSKYKKKIDK